MWKSLLWWAAGLLIKKFTDAALDGAQIERVKHLIAYQANLHIDNWIKHQEAAFLVKSFADDLADTVVDWVVRTVLWVGRLTGEIPTEPKS